MLTEPLWRSLPGSSMGDVDGKRSFEHAGLFGVQSSRSARSAGVTASVCTEPCAILQSVVYIGGNRTHPRPIQHPTQDAAGASGTPRVCRGSQAHSDQTEAISHISHRITTALRGAPPFQALAVDSAIYDHSAP